MTSICKSCHKEFKLESNGTGAGTADYFCRQCAENNSSVNDSQPRAIKFEFKNGHEKTTAGSIIESSVSIDLEVNGDKHIFHIGAVYGSKVFERKGSFNIPDALTELDRFCEGAAFVIGHNILRHDLPILGGYNPDLNLLKLPVIDTLYLSPLAFPENPYHHLVKNYKLVSDSRNDPVKDSRLAEAVFSDQWHSFQRLCKSDPETMAFYRYCFERARFESGDNAGAGMADILGRIGAYSVKTHAYAARIFKARTKGKACPGQVDKIIAETIEDPDGLMAMAYCLAWLQVAGGNSILPPWVRFKFQSVPAILKRLRDEPCGNQGCDYCRENHEPVTQLKKYFPFDKFRLQTDGTPLQETIVTRAMQGKPLFAMMATGSGKSLCFQLPAFVSYGRRGRLTVVITPLQALMKDQVVNLKKLTNSDAVGTVNGLLSPLERAAMLERVRLGGIGILYISPEQLRNHSVREALRTREIAAWVFDEAHCLSKWGHDFRPDYLYALRFIRDFAKEQQTGVPPVFCFTATAKKDVVYEARLLFEETLGHELHTYRGEIDRSNFNYEVRKVRSFEKNEVIKELLTEHMPPGGGGSAIIYCATRKKTEELRDFFRQSGWPIEAFHGGMDTVSKQRIQDAFIEGKTPLISATNAFGMGIDKADVRLIIHADIPGSLENYIQEVGRAGRDKRSAHCVLLYDENDVETQFKIGALSEIRKRDIAQILKGLRTVTRPIDNNEIIITAGELLCLDDVDTNFEHFDNWVDTKVKTAVAWLERAGFVERSENRTSVFAGRPKFKSMAEVKDKLDRLDLPAGKRLVWESLLDCLLLCRPDESVSTDHLAEHLGGISGIDSQQIPDTRKIIGILHEMAEQGLISSGVSMSAYIRFKGKNNARVILQRTYEIDRSMIDVLRQEHPDDTIDEWLTLDLRKLNQRLLDRRFEDCSTEILRSLLFQLSRDGKHFDAGWGSIEIRNAYRSRLQIKLRRPWDAISKIAERRRNLAYVLLNALYALVPSTRQGTKRLLIEFTLDDMVEALKRDFTVDLEPKHLLAAIDSGLLLLHEHNAIILQKGLAIFRQAMTIRVLPESKGRRYTNKDYQALADHYKERRRQIHIMDAYARRGLAKINDAKRLVKDYFAKLTKDFLRIHFPQEKKKLERATSRESYLNIVESLNNPTQQTIVTASMDKNMLILAGPGSGKTRVVVHRCAYLIRVKRVPAGSILMLCFNHSNALAMRRSLQKLIGNDARGVTVLTYHAMAMRLTGRSFADRVEINRDSNSSLSVTFKSIIKDAIDLLHGRKELLGVEPDQIRDRLLRGYRFILVDEYQDIDPLQYQLVSALTGRTLVDPDSQMSILAVGDDDQSIYGFRDANVKFIRQFKADYNAEEFHLVENYRSTHHLIEASNALIRHNQNRMKIKQPIRINRAREEAPAGGVWEAKDPDAGGRVRQLVVKDALGQALAVVHEIRRLKSIDTSVPETDIAVFARCGMDHPTLSCVRMALEAYSVPFSYPVKGDTPFRISRIREYANFLEHLSLIGNEWRTATHLIDLYREIMHDLPGIWDGEVFNLLEAWKIETGDSKCQVRTVIDFFYESLFEKGRENRLGRGVYLSTAHGAKGLEYPHVFVLDGDWKLQSNTFDQEEERRVFYVAVTRAIETLTIFSRQDSRNPFIDQIGSEHTFRRDMPIDYQKVPREVFLRTDLLGMRDIFIDFAGRQPADSQIHHELSKLKAGDELYPKNGSNQIRLCSANDIPVAQLSSSAATHWLPNLDKIKKIKTLGLVRRYANDVQPQFKARLQCEKWEIPMVEIYWQQ